MSRPWRWHGHNESQTKACPNCTNKSTGKPSTELPSPIKKQTTNFWPEIANPGDYLEDIEEDENHLLSKPYSPPSDNPTKSLPHDLPPELFDHIITYLPILTRFCLALTSKGLYSLHSSSIADTAETPFPTLTSPSSRNRPSRHNRCVLRAHGEPPVGVLRVLPGLASTKGISETPAEPY